MRAAGVVTGVEGLGLSDHVCWAYDDVRDFIPAGVQWLLDGLVLGEQLAYVADRTEEQMRVDLATIPELDEHVASGRLALAPLSALYELGQAIDPDAQLRTYGAMIDQALADGFTGLRVLAEVTELVRDPAVRAQHVHWEHVADAYMSEHPLSALCAYRRAALGDEIVTDLSAVHPVVREFDSASPFRLFFDNGRLQLAGVVDAFCSARLLRLLERSYPSEPTGHDLAAQSVPAGPTQLDLSGLEFIDVRGATTLAEFARGRRLVVTGAPSLLRRMWSVLHLDEVSGLRLGTA